MIARADSSVRADCPGCGHTFLFEQKPELPALVHCPACGQPYLLADETAAQRVVREPGGYMICPVCGLRGNKPDNTEGMAACPACGTAVVCLPTPPHLLMPDGTDPPIGRFYENATGEGRECPHCRTRVGGEAAPPADAHGIVTCSGCRRKWQWPRTENHQ